jgi:hypothetical protein
VTRKKARNRPTLAIADLVPDPANRRAHNPRNIGMITDALREVGAARSIVIDEGDVVLAGNGVREAAQAAGITKVRVIDAAGDELIAVRRRDLSPEQKRALAIYDNRAAELAEWNYEQLQKDKDAGLDLQPFWTAEEAAALLASKPTGGKTDPDAVPAVRAKTEIKLGDLFQLGAHRLLCGDATSAADVKRLMNDERAVLFATDPPYAVGYAGGSHPSTPGNKGAANKDKNWSGVYREIPETKTATRAPRKTWNGFDPIQGADNGSEFYARFVRVAVGGALSPTAAWYCWHASRRQAMLEKIWEDAGAFVHQQIIWSKSRPVLTYSIYMWAHEPCLMGWMRGRKPYVQAQAQRLPNDGVEHRERRGSLKRSPDQ